MNIPKEAKSIIEKLEKNKFEAFLVGGCVRDLLIGQEPEDWDIATNAKPEQIQKIFKDSFYENKFLTVTVKTGSKNPKLNEIEITTYRKESKYTDKRHPDKVNYAKTIEEDLARRDFTINAIAFGFKGKEERIIDPYGGQKDLKKKVVKAVGNPEERFSEDALRMMRAVRFASVFKFEIDKKTDSAIKKNAIWIEAIAKERIRDEFLKIIMSDNASSGIETLREIGLLKYIIPELEEGYKIAQNKHHIYDCYEHALHSLDYAAKKKFNKYVRIAVLLHDIAKPRVKKGKGLNATFYNHEVVGARMAVIILERLKFSKKDIEKIVKLVRYHLFYYNVGEVSDSSVRRLVSRAGLENMDELLQVRMADRIGSGVPKAEPYKLRHLRYLIEKVSSDPISAKFLEINGNDITKPGPKIGWILEVLLGYTLSDPGKNNKEFLTDKVEELGKLKDEEVKKQAENANKEREKIETKKDQMTKNKYWVT
jgi:poly(A) polymerase/tRNA nucleotidyltransferase (CCA-adding enzyme)